MWKIANIIEVTWKSNYLNSIVWNKPKKLNAKVDIEQKDKKEDIKKIDNTYKEYEHKSLSGYY